MLDRDFVVKSFSSKDELKHYVDASLNIGLWKSEEIVFNKYIKKDDAILDIGCGAGRTTIGLYEQGYLDIEGLDLADAMIIEAKEISKKKKIPVQFIVGDATNLQKHDNSYDVVIFSFNGLMAILKEENRLKAMSEIKRVLKNNGYFIFTTHDRDTSVGEYMQFWINEKEKWKKGLHDKKFFEFGDITFKNEDGIEQFIHIPDRNEIIEYLNKVGLKLVEDKLRRDISTESDEVNKFSKECRFWVAQK